MTNILQFTLLLFKKAQKLRTAITSNVTTTLSHRDFNYHYSWRKQQQQHLPSANPPKQRWLWYLPPSQIQLHQKWRKKKRNGENNVILRFPLPGFRGHDVTLTDLRTAQRAKDSCPGIGTPAAWSSPVEFSPETPEREKKRKRKRGASSSLSGLNLLNP